MTRNKILRASPYPPTPKCGTRLKCATHHIVPKTRARNRNIDESENRQISKHEESRSNIKNRSKTTSKGIVLFKSIVVSKHFQIIEFPLKGTVTLKATVALKGTVMLKCLWLAVASLWLRCVTSLCGLAVASQRPCCGLAGWPRCVALLWPRSGLVA